MSVERTPPSEDVERFRLSDWTSDATEAWNRIPIKLTHHLTETGLFTDEALADLIDRFPADQRSLVHMGSSKDERLWRTGRIDGLSGVDVIGHLGQCPLWLNLRSVDAADECYAGLFRSLLSELNEAVPHLGAYPGKMGILISGPGTCVDYHADLPGQALLQLRGEKTAHLYPAAPPYVSLEQLQDIAYDGVEKIAYRPVLENGATVLPLRAGEMLHWPHNAPHRIENGPMLNVSVTFEYLTPCIARLARMNLANGILRRRFGLRTTARPISGPGYWVRHLLQTAASKAGMMNAARRRGELGEFVLRKESSGAIAMQDVAT